jgi:uncharacterized phage-like protein YoqJ
MDNFEPEREIACAFTGHRPSKLPWGTNESDERCAKVKDALYDAIYGAYLIGKRHFICGMAAGCDIYFGEAVVRFRENHSDVTLEAAIPCSTQASKWGAEQSRRYGDLLSACDKKTVIQEVYTPDCPMRRNRYMVDHASLLIACYNGSPGGTRNTILYAMRSGVEIMEIAPALIEVPPTN